MKFAQHIIVVIVFLSHLALVFGGEEDDVKIEVLYKPPNCGYKSQVKDMLSIDYIGTFPDGRKFDSTYDRHKPMDYIMGEGNVIRGCEIGTMNMCEGEKRRIVVPPHLGYGNKQYGQIPPVFGREEDDVKIEVHYVPPKCEHKSQLNDMLRVDYVGTFLDGQKFDSTYDRKKPMVYTMGEHSVIRGFEIGTMNMCEGEKRRIVIPSYLAYGDVQHGKIPPGSTLVFDSILIELAADPFAL